MKHCGAVKRGSLVRMAVCSAVLALADGGALYAAEQAATVKIPETASAHLAMAQNYREKVKMYFQEVETHQQMLEAYKKRVPVNPKAQMENPWIKKMRKHCERYIAEARSLAAEAQEFAKYHELRGKELQGQ